MEELLAHNLSMLAVRAGAQSYRALPLVAEEQLKQRFLAALPLRLLKPSNGSPPKLNGI